MSENVADFAPQSAGDPLSAEGCRKDGGDWRFAGNSFEVGTVRMRASYPYPEDFCSTCSESESEELGEVWSPSTEGSLRVYFPRHSMRA